MAEDGWEDVPRPRGRGIAAILGVLVAVVGVALLVRVGVDEEADLPGRGLVVDETPSPEATATPAEDSTGTEGPEATEGSAPTEDAPPPGGAPRSTVSPNPLDPSNRWQPLSSPPFAGGIRGPGVWDGHRMILWPGAGSGGIYAPDVDAWASLPAAPIQRTAGWTATWTGREVLYWGGLDDAGAPTADGAALDPDAARWRRIPPSPLSPRTGHSATWGGGRLWVFGGRDDTGRLLGDGASFDPATQTWEPLPPGPLAGRVAPTLAWFDADADADADAEADAEADDDADGDPADDPAGELIVWGGLDGREDVRGDASRTDGARYRPGDGWQPMTSAPVPLRRLPATAWTGVEACPETGACGNLHVWGRPAAALSERDGYTYDAFRDEWSELPLLLGQTRSDAIGLWTGQITIVFGGRDQFDRVWRSDGFIFDANSERWRQIPRLPRDLGPQPIVLWTGEELLVWGDGAGVRLPLDHTSLR
jgi:hypothetical protein